jgi:ribosomal subunit interface protein
MDTPQRTAAEDEEARITISGHQVELGEALRNHAAEQLRRLSAKYFDGAEDITATFSRTGKSGFGCTLRVHAGRGLYFDGEGEDANAYTAFSTALNRVAKQLRRQKRALREDKPVNPTKEGLL